MTQKKQQEQEAMVEAMSKTETFIAQNGRKMAIALITLLIIGLGIYGVRELIILPNGDKAAEMIAQAELRLDESNPDYLVILNGDESGAGLLDVIQNYGSTPAGNLAKHYAGIAYLNLNDFDNAAKYLKMYKAVKGVPAAIVNSQNIALQGDVEVEKGNYAAAVKLFEKAAKNIGDGAVAPTYLKKAAVAAIAAEDNAKATELLETIIAEYPASPYVVLDAQKMLGTIQK